VTISVPTPSSASRQTTRTWPRHLSVRLFGSSGEFGCAGALSCCHYILYAVSEIAISQFEMEHFGKSYD
jgi:hypothetical protein